jgi:hypothetical protein
MNEINKNIIVFDSGNIHTPPIRPPDGIKWHSIILHDLYFDDEVNGDMGLTFPRIDGALPFIHLPQSMALDIWPMWACQNLHSSGLWEFQDIVSHLQQE